MATSPSNRTICHSLLQWILWPLLHPFPLTPATLAYSPRRHRMELAPLISATWWGWIRAPTPTTSPTSVRTRGSSKVTAFPTHEGLLLLALALNLVASHSFLLTRPQERANLENAQRRAELCAAPGSDLAVLVPNLPSTTSRKQGCVDQCLSVALILQQKQWRKKMTTMFRLK
jgi:hypothetical protein